MRRVEGKSRPVRSMGAARMSSTDATRVLVVDDEPDSAELLAVILRRFGYDARSAGSANNALLIAEAWHPSIALVDIEMPTVGGCELARRLRASAGNHDMTLIALTGFSDDESREFTKAAGFQDHLVKGVPLEILISTLGPASKPLNAAPTAA